MMDIYRLLVRGLKNSSGSTNKLALLVGGLATVPPDVIARVTKFELKWVIIDDDQTLLPEIKVELK